MPDSPEGMTPEKQQPPQISIANRWGTEVARKDVPPAPEAPKPWSERPFGEVLAAYKTETDPDIKKQQHERLEFLFLTAEMTMAGEVINRSAQKAINYSIYPNEALSAFDDSDKPRIDDDELKGVVEEMVRIVNLSLTHEDLDMHIAQVIASAQVPTDLLEQRSRVQLELDAASYWEPDIDMSRFGSMVDAAEIQRRIDVSTVPDPLMLRLRNDRIQNSADEKYLDVDSMRRMVATELRSSKPEEAAQKVRGLGDIYEAAASRNPTYESQYNNTAKVLLENAARQVDLYVKFVQGQVNEDQVRAQFAVINMPVDLLDGGNAVRNIGADVLDQDPNAAADSMSDAAEAMGRIADSLSGERGYDLPPDEEGQRRRIRAILDTIESTNHDTYAYLLSQTVRKLEVTEMLPAIAKEVELRLRLHDSSRLILQAGGWIENPVQPAYTIGNMATTASVRDRGMNREVVQTMLVEGLVDMDIAGAWDLLQEANYKPVEGDPVDRGYPGMIRQVNRGIQQENRIRLQRDPNASEAPEFEVEGREYADAQAELGTVPTCFYTDSNEPRKEAVRNYMVQRLVQNNVRVLRQKIENGEDAERSQRLLDSPDELRYNAEKSLQLAESLTIATLETSIFNKAAMAGNDQLAEGIGFLDYRAKRATPGRNRGSVFHELYIDNIGTSWLRKIAKKDDPNSKLLASEIAASLGEIKAGSWEGYCTTSVKRYYELKQLMLDVMVDRPGAKGINHEFIRKTVAYFNEADPVSDEFPTGKKQFRAWWLGGVVMEAANNYELGWTLWDLGKLRKAVSIDPISPDGKTFISKEEWDWVIEETNAKKKIALKAAGRGAAGALGGY